jgi:hypothetical protein
MWWGVGVLDPYYLCNAFVNHINFFIIDPDLKYISTSVSNKKYITKLQGFYFACLFSCFIPSETFDYFTTI